MEKRMVSEKWFMKMAMFTKGNGKMIKKVARVKCSTKTALLTKGNGKMTRWRVLEQLFGQTAENMLVILLGIKKMAKALHMMKMAPKNTKVIIKMVNLMDLAFKLFLTPNYMSNMKEGSSKGNIMDKAMNIFWRKRIT